MMWWFIMFVGLVCMVVNVCRGEGYANKGNMAGVVWALIFTFTGSAAFVTSIDKLGF